MYEREGSNYKLAMLTFDSPDHSTWSAMFYSYVYKLPHYRGCLKVCCTARRIMEEKYIQSDPPLHDDHPPMSEKISRDAYEAQFN